jgi:phosphatidate cytidylyltransferase
MLLQRIITAIILAPLAALAVFKLPPIYFSLVWGLFILLAAWEWANLSGIANIFMRILFLFILTCSMAFIEYWTVFLEIIAEEFNWLEVKKQSGILEWVMAFPVLWWFWTMLRIRNKAGVMLKKEQKPARKALIGWIILLTAWMAFARLRNFYGAEFAMYFLLLIWGADIAAYFTGKKYGKTKLSPEISPGKTVEGMYGALASALVFGILLGLYSQFPIVIILDFIMLSILTVLISIYGDLFVSLLKRQRGVKDSGSLLPGHGGVLDRLDSIIAGAPFFYSGVLLIWVVHT